MSTEQAGARPGKNIAMWGAPGSGKTTMLAALGIALARRPDWLIASSDEASMEYLITMTNALSDGRAFPLASESLESYHWTLIGPEQQPRSWWRHRRGPGALRISLSLVDVPGGWYGDKNPPAPEAAKKLQDNLAQSEGIVFLFDPIREFEIGDAFEHLHGPLTKLASRILGGPGATADRLPHYISICITKFDEPQVLDTARQLGLLTTRPDDPHGFPVVRSEEARTLLEGLCSVSATGSADLMLNNLSKYFHKDRIKFFVTSSIGFHLNRDTGRFDQGNVRNMIPTTPSPSLGGAPPLVSEREFRIRGQVHPINVVEPLLWLGRRLSGDRTAP
ncbi:hypothetical protein [Acrocarpospora phusangensis]|nr:hypothetical protein [Acrocarpospora phusangensis]